MSSRNQRREDQSWEDWFKELCQIANKEGFELRKGVFNAEIAVWREMYDEGLSPKDAWEKA